MVDDYQAVTEYGKAIQQLADSTDSVASSFAAAAKGSEAWTMASRILSGSGLWKLQNYVRSVGNAINIFNTNTKEQELRMMKNQETMMGLGKTYISLGKQIEQAKEKTGAYYEMLMMLGDYTEEQASKKAVEELSSVYGRVGTRIRDIRDKTKDMAKNKGRELISYFKPREEGDGRSRLGYLGDVLKKSKIATTFGKVKNSFGAFYQMENKISKGKILLFRGIMPLIKRGIVMFFTTAIPMLLAGLSILAGMALQVVLYIAGIVLAITLIVKIVRTMGLGETFSKIMDYLGTFGIILSGLGNITDGIWKLLTGMFEGNFKKVFFAFGQILLGIGQVLLGILLTSLGVLASLIVGAVYSIPKAIAKGMGKILPFANGGITRGGLSVVGERGPELVSLPRGSRVYSNAQSQKIGGGGNNIHVHISGRVGASDSEIRDIANKVAREVNLRMNRTGSAVGRF